MSDRKLKNEVVKTHRLNTALQKLSLSEIRLMQLAIIDARETGTGIDTVTPLPIHASRYAEAFGVTRQTAYEVLIEAETSLFKRYFTFLDERDGKPVKSHWVSQAKYLDNEAIIEIMLTPAVVKEITRIDAIEAKTLFTRFALEQVASMKSVYSVRLYELLNQWRQAKKVSFDLNIFRGQLGVEDTEYKAMSDFKKRVLDLAVNEINEKSDITVEYKQHKKGSRISSFSFTIKPKKSDKLATDDNGFIKLSEPQIKLFSNKLAALSELGSNAPIGASTDEYAQVIANELRDTNQQQKYHKYLSKVGYQQKIK
jgi:plasmid replication initiation protein